ncbi:hypothetical protein [Leucobacter tenebrionis]|uniref:hypothetical protein n=1 Tax=Leucobacter tenebrionis TaxID=2873270 RepID=UPI001CA67985|nr:hypothetical protein [Leucobacter tenebrionis]QZY52901.1 hypothetical protein KVY00_05560 [Leucobacter tenebrionis]
MSEHPTVEALYLGVIEAAIAAHPRSLQKRIGPSEIGIECDRRILYKLAGVDEPPRPPAWKPAVGTAVHDQLERWFDATNPSGDVARSDWVTEWEITVGMLGTGPDAIPITGHSDLFHVPSGTVIDHKVVGPKQLTKYRLHGPSRQYRVQAHLYGKGFTETGGWGDAKHVAISFLPRDGELSKAYWWHEPYNPHIAAEALNRLNALWGLLQIVGLEAALRAKPLCDDEWCPWCSRERPAPERRNVFEPGHGPVTPRPLTPAPAPSPALPQPLPGLGQYPQTPQPRRSNLFQ